MSARVATALFARYGGACWLCRVRPAKAIDHCHKTKRIRGALCHGCNSVVVARIEADPGYFDRVEAYLEPDQPCHADVLLEIANS